MSRGGSLLVWFAVALLLVAAPALAQIDGTDCGCEETGAYVEPDPGVKPPLAAGTGSSPGGRYRVEIASQVPPRINVIRESDEAMLLHEIDGVQWAFSPDGDRFVIGFFTGTLPNQQFEYALHDLTSATPASPIWNSGPTPWSSARIRFSDDGAVFLFAGHNATVGTSLTLIEVESRSLYAKNFSASSPPQDLDDDDDPSVAGWGFGPDPTRFVYGYNLNAAQGVTQWGRVNVATHAAREDTYTADSLFAVFSPCGDVIAFVVKQLALSDLTDVAIYPTRDPLAAQLGSENLPNSALEVQTTLAQHQVLQAGEPWELAPNHADDLCPASIPPIADFDAPPGLVAGAPGAFTDRSTDADGDVVAWQWEFGDGATSSARNPSHAYATSGTFRVRLTVTDDDGETDSIEKDVSVCGSLGALSGRVLFTDDGDLYAVNADDGSRVRLTNRGDSYSEITSARFSPDGSQIAYAEVGTFLAGIWLMNADGSERRRLTDGSGPHGDFDFHSFPSWSPDGAWIAYHERDVVTPAKQGIWMMRADGSTAAKVPGTDRLDHTPTIAPEIAASCVGLPATQRGPGCYTIVFNRDPGTDASGNYRGRIAQIAGDGSTLAFLTSVGSYVMPRVSPDGDQLAYSRNFGIGGGTFVFTAPRAGGDARQITSGGDEIFLHPIWAPGGDALGYAFSVDVIPGRITDLEIGVSDPSACDSRVLFASPGLQRSQDWATGHAVQGLGSIEGQVGLDTGFLSTVAGAIVEIFGDVQATTTTDAQGNFRFDDIPIGANVTLRFVSAPGYLPFPSVPPSFSDFTGHAVAVKVIATLANATIGGTVRDESGVPLPGVRLGAGNPLGSIEATTDANGVYSLTLPKHADYTLTPSLAGYRFEPPSFELQDFTGWFEPLDFTAIPLPPPGKIAFVSDESGDDEIYSADLDGGNRVDLTEHAANDRDPAWSPDGTRIAFASDRDGAFALFVMNQDGSDVMPLDVEGREPAWSPDASQIAYATDFGLRVLTLGSGAVSVLTQDPADASPRWRTDGSGFVTFERTVSASDADLYEVTPDAIEFPFIQTNTQFIEGDPAWSPTGQRLAYASEFGAQLGAPAIWTRDFDSGSWQGLQTGANPTWSPDGAWVAFDANGSIFYRDWQDAFALARTISNSAFDRDPDWQPSGLGSACSNGIDDDGDDTVDGADPGCANEADASEQTDAPGCDNGLDDDGDGFADMEDPGCPFPVAPFEDPICDNGIDDDGDGYIDAEDSICASNWPYHEEECGLGVELAFVLGVIRWRLRRLGA